MTTRTPHTLAACRRAAFGVAIALALAGPAAAASPASATVPVAVDAAVDASFDRSLLSGAGQNTDDLSRFERGNPVLSGTYNADIYINGNWVGRRDVRFQSVPGQSSAVPCLSRELLVQFGLRPADLPSPPADTACGDLASLIPGASARFDQADLRLDLSVPQAFMGRAARGYVSPEYWDEGVTAALLNYTFNSYRSSSRGVSQTSSYLGLNAGLNLGAWQIRQNSTLTVQSGQGGTQRHWQNIATYVQRDLPSLRAQLTVGDSYTSGELFDSVGLRGVQIGTDDRMLPDSLRGYAPTVRGVADSNAKVTVKQNGIVIYETTVSPGPFVIDDLFPTGYGGDLDVSVTEANGRVHSFAVPYASVAQLLRPGITRFNVAAGQVRDQMLANRPDVLQATLQHGFTNLLTGYTGVAGSQGYAALLLGGALNTRLGALALDVTGARTRIPGMSAMSGQSVRLSYSKILPQTDTSLTVAAYRYSTSGYLSLHDAMQARDYAQRGLPVFATGPALPTDALDGVIPGLLTPAQKQALLDSGYAGLALRPGIDRQRNRFDLTLSQQLGERGGSFYANVSSRDYWNRSSTDTQFQLGYSNRFRRLGYNLSATRVRDPLGRSENQFFASFSLPLGNSANAPTFTGNVTRDGSRTLDQASINGSAGEDNRFTYGATASHDSGGNGNAASVNGGYRGSYGQLNASYGKGSGYSQASLGIAGAVVAHPGGITFGQSIGDTVAIVSAPDAAGTRVTNAPDVRLDHAGHALIPYLTPYSLNTIELDPKGIPLNVQLDSTSTQVAPFAGAVVMVKFKTSSGRSAIIRARRPDGQAVPFGAEVVDARQQALGVVGQAGRMLVRGVQDEGQLTVQWQDEDGAAQSCSFPYRLKPLAKGAAAQAYEQIDATCASPEAPMPSSRSGT